MYSMIWVWIIVYSSHCIIAVIFIVLHLTKKGEHTALYQMNSSVYIKTLCVCVHVLTAERHGSLCRSTDDQGSAGSPWQHGAAQGGSLSSQSPATRQAAWVVWCILGHCLASHLSYDRQCGSFGAF